MAEPDAGGGSFGSGASSGGAVPPGVPAAPHAPISSPQGLQPKDSLKAKTDVNIPGIKEMGTSLSALTRAVESLKTGMSNLVPTLKAVADGYKKVRTEAKSTTEVMTSANKASTPDKSGASQTVWSADSSSGSKWWNRASSLVGAGQSAAAAYQATTKGGDPATSDKVAAGTMGQGVASAIGNFMGNITGQGGIGGFLTAGLTGPAQLYGAVSGSGIQYAANRINGAGGNNNAMLGLAQSLGPNAGMMNMTIEDMIRGLAQRAPVMGSGADITNTIIAGQSVGALMKGTEGRNGFFESVRQMQALTPGAPAGSMANSLAGYIKNTGSQQMGQFMGEGAFTMIGQGGRYKSLSEWAVGITKFFQEQRPGGGQGKPFTQEELMAQNFPGSNINAWFQMMGVPGDMVDYWWQYVLATAGKAAGPITEDTLKKIVGRTRGIDLGLEQLRSTTQNTRRDYLMGNQMYGQYAMAQSADRRFNVAMQGTDAAIAQTMKTSNLGSIMSLLPTPIREMLMPILTGLATSPAGGIAAGVGALFGDPIGDPIGDTGYGGRGATTTSHMTPDLSKRVGAMMRANPKLRISSGYRDTVTQNRLSKQGYKVGGSSASHARGWAADIGPTDQLGWVAQNAGKFGLQTGTRYGEPWHVQMGGTMPVGDPQDPIGDGFLGSGFGPDVGPDLNPLNIVKNLAGDFFKMISKMMSGIMGTILSPIQDMITKFVGTGGFSGMVDTATGMYSKAITAPLMGLAKLLGPNNMGTQDVAAIINAPHQNTFSAFGMEFKGFTPGDTGPQVFDAGMGDPIGDPGVLGLLSQATSGAMKAASGRTIIFKTDVTISGNMNSGGDARKAANTLVDHFEDVLASRDWRNK